MKSFFFSSRQLLIKKSQIRKIAPNQFFSHKAIPTSNQCDYIFHVSHTTLRLDFFQTD